MSLTLVCESCGEVFGPSDARGILILGPGYARYGCPECGYVVRSVPPSPGAIEETTENEPTPAIVPIEESERDEPPEPLTSGDE